VQIANAAGVAAIGALYFAIDAQITSQVAMLSALATFAASIAACVALLSWMRRAAA